MARNNFERLCGTPTIRHGQVVLTFDDGPGPVTAELARWLQGEGIVGTFFILGDSVATGLAGLKALRECGHILGLHGDEHKAFTSPAHAREQLDKCRSGIPGPLAARPWFRPPYEADDLPAEGYLGPVGWDADGEDWTIPGGQQTVAGCVAMIAARLHVTGGGIVLLHDDAPVLETRGSAAAQPPLPTMEIARALIPRLRQAGFAFGHLDEYREAGR